MFQSRLVRTDFSSKEEKSQFQRQILYQQHQTATTKAQVQPYAVTFQAHPEYISPTYRIQRELYQYSSINGGSRICRTTNVKGGL